MKFDEIDPAKAYLPPVSQDFARPEPPDDEAPAGLLRACWGAAKAGFRRVSYVTGPICLGFVVFGLAMMVFGIGSGRGWSLPTMLLKDVGAFLASGLYGSIFGVVLFLFSRAIPSRIRSSVAEISHRPISLFPRIGSMVQRVLSFWPWAVGLPIFLIHATAFGLGVYAGKAVDRRLAEAIAAADRDDPHWRLDDLMAHREIVPDDENSAIVVARALEHLPEAWPFRVPIQPGMPLPPLLPAGQISEQVSKMDANLRMDDESAGILREELAGRAEAVRIAVGGVALQSAQRILAQGEPSDDALARFQVFVLDEASQPLLWTHLKGERATMTELIRRVGDGEVSWSALSGDVGDHKGTLPETGPWGKLWFQYQRAVAIDWMTQLSQIAKLPPPERPALWKAFEDRFDAEKRTPFGIYLETLPILLMPAVSAYGTADSRYQSSLDAMALLLAAERHRLKTGQWPESIAAIDSQILANPPLDPFSGKPFLLDRRDGQLFVHSIGPNGRDEHGAYEIRRWMSGGADDVGYSAWDVTLRNQANP